ncbi:uncharacterized protein [Dermacentor albipictus]|uniref:uncharacterized protein n=1 Tax=Dermacentor albipictus TaxID=60249 RepID=UPI0031FC7695
MKGTANGQESRILGKSKASKRASNAAFASKEQLTSATSKTRRESAAKASKRASLVADLATEGSRRFSKDRSKMSVKKPRMEGKSGPPTEMTKKSGGEKKSDASIAKRPAGKATAGAGIGLRSATSKMNVSSKPKSGSAVSKGDVAKRDISGEAGGSRPNADVTASSMGGKPKGVAGASSDKGDKDKAKPRKKSHQLHERRKTLVVAAMSKMIGMRRNRPGKKRDSDSEESLSSKEQLSLFVVAMLAAFFFCFLVALLFYYFFTGGNIPEVVVACVSDECKEAMKFLVGHLNDAKKPCVDFYGHVCDSWHGKDSSFQDDVARAALIFFNRSLFSTIKVKHENDIRHGLHIMQPVYRRAPPPLSGGAKSNCTKRSCYRYMSVPVNLKDAMKETHELLDLSNLVKAPSFFDVVRFLVRQSMQIGVNTLFRSIFVYELGRKTLFLARGSSLRDKFNTPFNSGAGRHYFEVTLQAWLDLDNVNRQLSLLITVDDEVHRLLTGRVPPEEQVSLRDFVLDMLPNVSAEQWVQAVKESHRQDVLLEATDDILVQGGRDFKAAFQRLASRGLQNTTFYLATSLVAGVAGMLSQRDELAKSEVAKAHHCLQFTHKCLTLTWAYLASQYASTPSSVSVLDAMLAGIRGVVTEKPDTFTWMEKVARNKTADKLHRTTLRVIAGSGFNVSRINYPEELPPFAADDSFLKVLVVALRLQYTVMSASPPTRLEMLLSDLEFGATVKYVPEKQYIVLPTLYQGIDVPKQAQARRVQRRPYLYGDSVPEYFNYGTVGALISQRLVEAAGVSVANSRQAAWDGTTRSQYADAIACLVDRRKRMGFGDPGKEATAEQQTQLLALSISVRLAYLGLAKIFRIRSGAFKVFTAYWPEAQRVFFARYCLLWCSGRASDGDPLTPREKCMIPLRNMQEFADLYHCDFNATSSGGPLCKI